MRRKQWMDATAAFYVDALTLAAMPVPEDGDSDGSGRECDAYWELSDEIEKAGAAAGLTEAEMIALITAADSEHDGCSPMAAAAVFADLAATRYSVEVPS